MPKRVAIIGLGLIGGSLGLALTRRRLARRVIGVSRSPETLRRARRARAIHEGTTDLREAVRGADLVVLATPVETIVPLAKRAARFMRPGSVLTDVGSTKGAIVAALERGLPTGVAFVGGHPIAGSESRGFGAARHDLFDGSVCILTPTARTPRQALRRVAAFWKPLAERVVTMAPSAHDRLLAGASHLPHLLAYALAHAVDGRQLPMAPRSFLEMTRLAKSSPELWDDIFLSNRREVLAAMTRFERSWRLLRASIGRARRGALRAQLARAQAKREALAEG